MNRIIRIGHCDGPQRKGVFFVLAIISLVGAMTFVGMSVDLGIITVTKTRMQAAADAASLAAAQEIVVAVREAAEAGITEVQTVQTLSGQQARDMAEHVADLNGFYIDPDADVTLGSRILGPDGTSYVEVWGTPPYNMVKVTIRMDNPDMEAPDAKLPLLFAPVAGNRSQTITASATAFIEARDIVAVLDYSGSMAYDSLIDSGTVNRLGLSAVESSLDDIWDSLAESGVRFSDDAATEKFPSAGLGGIDSYDGGYLSSSSVDTVFEALNLVQDEADSDGDLYWENWPSGNHSYGQYRLGTGYGRNWLVFVSGSYNGYLFSNTGGSSYSYYGQYTDYPGYVPEQSSAGYVAFPQEGKNPATGQLLGKPSAAESEALWRGYIQYVMTNGTLNSHGYRKKYNYRTLMHYLISQRMQNHYSEDLWRAPIYPHHAMKEGMTMFTTFLDNLGYGDHTGLVTYATTSRIQTGLWDDGVNETVDLGGQHLTDDYTGINTIQVHKQPGHYDRSTGIGYGLDDAIDLIDRQGRYGAQKAILLMTDGQANQYPSGFGLDSLPGGWNWNEITDFDGDGTADFVIDNSYGGWDSNWRASLYAFMKAKEARDANIVINTISVGAGADTDLMQAIAAMTGGTYLNVPGGASVADMEHELETAFATLAGRVPPARLIVGEE